MIKNIRFTVVFASLLTLAITSCKKEEAPDSDTLALLDAETAESAFTDVALIADEALYSQSDSAGILGLGCVTMTYDTLDPSNEDTLLINFGSADCSGADISIRRGSLMIRTTGDYTDSGAVSIITYNNYYWNHIRLDGTTTLTRLDPDSVYMTPAVKAVTTGSITLTTGFSAQWYSNKTIRWSAGHTTDSSQDNVYQVSGFANGTVSTGRTYASQITSPLVLKAETLCRRHFSSGSFALHPAQMSVRHLDLGDGSCDNVATGIIDGLTYQVNLR